MSTAVLSLGANLAEPLSALQAAVDLHRRWLQAASPVYETEPWGPVPQPAFLNAVLLVTDPGATPADWLSRAQAAEQQAGRVRNQRWGPRVLDVDVIAVDDVRSDDPRLTLPHPRAAVRAFVLVPWLAVDPQAVLAGRPVAERVADLPATERAGVRLRPDLVVA